MSDPTPPTTGPTRDWEAIAANEPEWREEREIKPGRARLHIRTHARPVTTRVSHDLVGNGGTNPLVAVRSSNQMPVEADAKVTGLFRYSGSRSFLDGLGLSKTTMLPLLGIAFAAVVGISLLRRR